MSTDHGPRRVRNAAHRPTEREGRIRTCVSARATQRECRARKARKGHEAADQDWNVVRGED
ncbi:hypothetical protein ACIOJD_24360 [Streptomyces sp. NPDC088116]|uniref:hypothetical protein n=1 Tax=Streptomyces sp. NPDC088116 TaxID=3365825 RepID=UPI0038155D3A